MARKSSIASHPKRAEIDKDLLAEIPLRTISDRYGPSKSALIRYRDQHLGSVSEEVRADPRVGEAVENAVIATVEAANGAERFNQRVATLTGKIDILLEQAEQAQNVGAQIAAIREARGLLDLESKVVIGMLGLKGDDKPLEIRWIEE